VLNHEEAKQQIDDAQQGKAKNQCPFCRAFRMDGQPPIRHKDGCTRKRRQRLDITDRWYPR
jgi:hypothetical protein